MKAESLMSTAFANARPEMPTLSRWSLLWLGLIAFTILLMWARDAVPLAFSYPRAWQLPLAGWITDFMKWLINSFDLGLFTFKEFTRAIAWVVEQPEMNPFFNFAYGKNQRDPGYLYPMLEYEVRGSPFQYDSWRKSGMRLPEGVLETVN